MITITATELCVCIADGEPEQRRNLLIKAIAAYMRHAATAAANGEAYTTDWENQYTMAQLLEALVTVEP